MRKICRIMLALALVFSLSNSMVTYAGSNENGIGLSADTMAKLNEQLYFAYLDAENLGLSQNDFDELYIGSPIHSYECINNSLQEMDILTYPIICDNKIVLSMNESENGGEKIINLTQCFAEELTEYYLSEEKIALVYDDEKCYAASEDAIEELTSFGYQVEYRDSLSECEQENIVLSRIQQVENVEYTGNRIRASYAYLAVPVVLQGDYNIYWAASTACIGNYLTSYNYTAVDIARAGYGDFFDAGAGVEMAMAELQENYGITYDFSEETEILSDATIYKNLIEGYPVYAKWISGNLFHSTVIRGILTDSYIMIMDPNYGFSVIYKSGNTYSYVESSSGITLTFGGCGAKSGY